MISFEEFTLANGLKVIVHEDPDTTMAVVDVIYNVGSRDEDENLTGFAHLFEHLMFGGSVNIPDFDAPLQRAGGERCESRRRGEGSRVKTQNEGPRPPPRRCVRMAGTWRCSSDPPQRWIAVVEALFCKRMCYSIFAMRGSNLPMRLGSGPMIACI